MRIARAPRFLIALALVVSAVAFNPTDARAQFVCNPAAPTPGDSVICTITGAVGAFANTTTLTGNATINITPTGSASSTFATTDDGNALVQNQGLVGLLNATSLGTGNATSINLFGATAGVMQTTSQSGIASSQNAGAIALGIETVAQNGGTAISNNTGTADTISTTTPNGGTATTTNSGTVENTTSISLVSLPGYALYTTGILTSTVGGPGNATTINTGTIKGSVTDLGIVTAADVGAATTTNTGIVFGGTSTTTGVSFPGGIGGGPATTTNFGTIFGDVTNYTQLGGNAVTSNSGYVGGVITNYTVEGGDAFVTNSGTVANNVFPGFNPGISNYTSTGGNATTTNSSTGVVNGGVSTISGNIFGGGDASFFNAGKVNGDVYVSAVEGMDPGQTGNALLSNSGSIVADFRGVQVSSASGNATLANFGTIDVSNAPFFGQLVLVGSLNGNASAYNAGRIYGELDVFAAGGTATISNAGLIDASRTSSGTAIDLFNPIPGSQTVLNLLPGSRIIGQIGLNGDLGSVPGTTVNFFSGADISSVTTFGLGCGCGGGLTDTGSIVNVFGGAPYVIFGNTVAIIDPTSFAVQDRNLTEFSHTISSMITSRLNNPAPLSGGSSVSGFAPSGSVAADMARDAFAGISSLNYASSDRVLFSNPSMTAADGTSVWAQGFAGQRIQDASAPVLRSVNNFYGGMIGIDKAVRPDLRVGALLGAGNIKSNIDLNSGSTDSDIVFGGVYGRYAMNQSFFDFALTGGHGRNDLTRNMTNNLALNGIETATAKYNSWFISPEVAYGVRKNLWPNWTLTPTARVRYLAAGFGGYQESGSTTNLTVASRVSHNFEERAELTLTRTSDPVPTQRMQVSGTLGAVALQRAGDTTVNSILLGQALPFATPGKNDIYGVYSGVGFDWRNNKGVTVFGAAEYTAMTDSSRTATAKGGVRMVF